MNFKRRSESRAGSTPARTFFDPYESEGLIKKVRKEVILPGVTFNEEKRLEKIHAFIEEKTGKPSTLPQHMINDIYSMYVNKDIKKKESNKYNRVKHKVINSAYSSLTKSISQDSVLFSQIVTREVALYMQKVQDLIEEELEKNGQEGGGPGMDQEGEGDDDDSEGDSDENGDPQGGSGAGKDGSSSGKAPKGFDKKVDEILKNTKSDLEKAMDNAEKEIKEIETLLGKEASKELSNTDPNFLEEFNKLKALLKTVSFNKESIKTVLMKILNKSQNYFSKNSIAIEESIFDVEEIEELFGLEFLHPIFRGAGILDVGNESRLYTGKIDLYLDCSGSMTSHEQFESKNIRMIDLVKGIAIMLYRMNMIDKLYFFDTGIYEIQNINELSILSFDKSGGTDFNKVVNQTLSNKRNSVIITDGEDRCSKYAKNVFWIGIGGTQFNTDDEFKTYRAIRQCVTYNKKTSNFDYCK